MIQKLIEALLRLIGRGNDRSEDRADFQAVTGGMRLLIEQQGKRIDHLELEQQQQYLKLQQCEDACRDCEAEREDLARRVQVLEQQRKE